MHPEHADPHAITATAPYAVTASAPHAATAHAATAPFSDTEIKSLHAQDVAAGRAVVVLMCSIFLLGVFIYTIVACTIVF
jgi:hypothetical protein